MSLSAAAGMRVQRQRDSALRPILRYDPVLLGAVLLLLMLGVVMVYSASAVYAGARLGDGLWFFKRQAGAAAAGVAVVLLVMRVGYRRFEPLAVPLVILSLALLVLLQFPGLGHAAGGARRWMKLGSLIFQPSEIAKISLVLWLSRSLARKQDRIRVFSVGFLPHITVLGLFTILLLLEPDFGTTVVLGVLTVALLFAAGVRLSWLIGLGAATAPVLALLVWRSPYRTPASYASSAGSSRGRPARPITPPRSRSTPRPRASMNAKKTCRGMSSRTPVYLASFTTPMISIGVFVPGLIPKPMCRPIGLRSPK